MRIKSAIRILKEVVYLKSVLKRYSDSMECGKYFLFDGFRAMSKDDFKTKERAKVYFTKPGINSRMVQVASILNRTSYYSIKNKRSSEEYDAFYTANNYDKLREVKLFSFKSGKMLTICKNREDFDNQIKQYGILRNAYNIPPVIPKEKYANSIEVSMVDIGESPSDVCALENIAFSTKKFNPNVDVLQKVKGRELVEHSYDNDMSALLNDIVSKIDKSVLERSVPLCMQHGDLSKDNLLYGTVEGKNDCWWIDWEHASERVFFYDFFFYIINI